LRRSDIKTQGPNGGPDIRDPAAEFLTFERGFPCDRPGKAIGQQIETLDHYPCLRCHLIVSHDREKHGNIRVARSILVISRAGTVRLGSISGDYRWRVGPEEVLAVLKPSAN